MIAIKILLPNIPSSKDIYLKGYIERLDDSNLTIYITKYAENRELLHRNTQKDSKNAIYGYVGCKSRQIPKKYQNFIHMEQNATDLKNLKISYQEISKNNCIIMIYDYDSFKDSQAVSVSNDCFSKLVSLIQDEHGSSVGKDYVSNFKSPPHLFTSMLLQHTYNYWRLFRWLIPISNRDNKISIKHRSLILAIMLDFALGYVALQLLPQDKATIASTLTEVLQELISLLQSLLEWLMGAPVGLKLNKAFNKMLGNFFTYHVHLWKLFVDVSTERLDILVDIYRYIGYFGITFQLAFISDWICLVTFHVYCFYGYAARLYNIQISGLTALLRLFVGRKYNPLRCAYDSCEYTKEELFVGTLAFTIMLLLLPTTVLYYIVFTGFRVVSLIVQNVLAESIYLVQSSPLYVLYLWVTRSPKLKGNFVIEEIHEEWKYRKQISNDTEDEVIQDLNGNSPLLLKIKLVYKPISELVKLFRPPIDIPIQLEWTNLLSNIFHGKQI